MPTINRRCCLDCAITTVLFITMTTVVYVTGDSGLCRIYSFNVERQHDASSWQPNLFNNNKLLVSASVVERRYFMCCQDDGAETACRDKTYQRPSNGKTGHAEEFCRGEVVVPGDVTRHWIEDETELFVADELIYCGGCCGQQMAANVCSERLKVMTRTGQEDGVCDRWITCFIDQCQMNALEVLAGRTPHCSVPPPPYPKHFIHERRALPLNLSLALEAQMLHSMTSSSASSDQNRMTSSVLVSDAECSRRYCHGVQPSDRCFTGCCRSRFCCDQQTNSAVDDAEQWPISAEKLVALSVVFGIVAIVCGLLLVIFPGTRRCNVRRRTASVLAPTSGSGSISSAVTSSRAAAVGLGRTAMPSGGSRMTSTGGSRQTRRTHESAILVDNDEFEDRFSDTRILVIAEEGEDHDGEMEDRGGEGSDVDSV